MPVTAKCENACFQILPALDAAVSRWCRWLKCGPIAASRPPTGWPSGAPAAGRRPGHPRVRPDLSELTVRGICRQAGIAARYFYESFTDKDEFVAAVFDWVIADIAATTQAAVARGTAGGTDPRRHGQHRADHRRRSPGGPAAVQLTAGQPGAGAQARGSRRCCWRCCLASRWSARCRCGDNDKVKATAHFVVGGVVQTISAWLAGEVDLEPDQLVDQLGSVLDQLADPQLYRA